jgi:hypothetical protein
VAADYAAIRGGQLSRAGHSVNALDLLIAGTAREYHAETILTADEDFRTIAPLENYEVRGYRT